MDHQLSIERHRDTGRSGFVSGSVISSDAGEMTAQGTTPRSNGKIRLRYWGTLVLVLAALLLFLRLGERALWGPEGRWAEITREMRLTGNYFWPTINGTVYYDKPLLSYWLVAGAASVTGVLDEFAARLPSAIAGWLGVALLMLLTRRLYGLRTAIIASFILATSYSYVFFSRLASADVETVAGVLAALALFVQNERRPSGWWLVAFWLTMAITSLTKGLLGFVLPLLVVGLYSLIAEGWRDFWERSLRGSSGSRLVWLIARLRWFFNKWTLLAMAVTLSVYFLPFAASYKQMESNAGIYQVLHENVVRFFLPFDHQGPVYLYLYGIFPLMAPWSLFLPAALVQIHCRPADRRDRFTMAYFWATFLFFTLSGSRRDYYLLPILPGAALLVALLFATPKEALDRRARKLMHLGFYLLGLLVLILGLAALLPPALRPEGWSGFPSTPEPIVLAPILLLILATVVYALVDMRQERVLFSSAVVAYLSLLFLFVFALPVVERYRGEKSFAQAVREEVKGDMSRVLLFKIWGPGLLFYLAAPQPLFVYSGEATLAQVIEQNGDHWIILKDPDSHPLPSGSSAAKVSQFFKWQKPFLFNDYILLRPKSIAEDKDGGRPEPLHSKAAR